MNKMDAISPTPVPVTSEPIVQKPSMDNFRLRSEPLFPTGNDIVNPALLPPRGLLQSPAVPSDGGRVDPDLATSRRALPAVRAWQEDAAERLFEGDRLENVQDAAEVAAITRDQIRWEPRLAMVAQANTSPANVLAVLR